MEKLTDQSPMPFGVHKDKPMQDVPAPYLHWLWVNGKKTDTNHPIHHYIKDNMDALKMKVKDKIWD